MRRKKPIRKKPPVDADARYEMLASQEEVYIEETEEELRMILISEDSATFVEQETVSQDCSFVAKSLDEELGHAAEELITGDSDDPPLSEEVVMDMLRVSRCYRSPL